MISTSWILTSNRVPTGFTKRYYINALSQAECFQMFIDQDDTEVNLEWENLVANKWRWHSTTWKFSESSPLSASISHGFLGAVNPKIEHSFSIEEVAGEQFLHAHCSSCHVWIHLIPKNPTGFLFNVTC